MREDLLKIIVKTEKKNIYLLNWLKDANVSSKLDLLYPMIISNTGEKKTKA